MKYLTPFGALLAATLCTAAGTQARADVPAEAPTPYTYAAPASGTLSLPSAASS